MKTLLVLVAAVLPQLSLAARILAMFPIPAKSHHMLINAMVRTLATRGHKVVLYTPYAWDQPLDNLTVVHLDNIVSMDLKISKQTLKDYMSHSPIGMTIPLLHSCGGLIENVYKNQKVLDLVKSNEHFDLVLVEAFYSQEPFIALGKVFNAPVIAMHPFGAFGPANRVMGNPLNLAYIPDFGTPTSDKMSFIERLLNAYSILYPLYYYYTQHLPAKNELMRQLFKDPTIPPVEELVQDISLLLNNAHPHVHYTQPYAPNVVTIGGIHLQTEQKPLPLAIKKFLDEGPDGVIYFSLGSITPDDKFGEEYFAKFLNVFRLLPQRVLWKTNAVIQDPPSNVMTAKWIPQQDVLAHPHVTVFMTHGGLFSQHEAIFAGVPVICMPLMLDQPMNAKFYEEKGIGVRLLYDTLSEETIHKALTTVISDPRYRDNMARMSRIYRDRPLSPADTLLYWVEYVIRHGGAPHLRPASVSMLFYQLYLLDVIGAIILASLLTLFVIYVFFRLLLRKVMYSKFFISKQFFNERDSNVDTRNIKLFANKLD